MTAQGMIDRLQNAIKHGQNPDAEMMGWDVDAEEWLPITVVVLGKEEVRVYTDEL